MSWRVCEIFFIWFASPYRQLEPKTWKTTFCDRKHLLRSLITIYCPGSKHFTKQELKRTTSNVPRGWRCCHARWFTNPQNEISNHYHGTMRFIVSGTRSVATAGTWFERYGFSCVGSYDFESLWDGPISVINVLKQRITSAWNDLSPDVIRTAASEFIPHVTAVFKQQGSQIQHIFQK